jgi:hypothetical protein
VHSGARAFAAGTEDVENAQPGLLHFNSDLSAVTGCPVITFNGFDPEAAALLHTWFG